ncbi:FecCD family ABC transporter permease [Streptomyces nanshensis]|uniref:Iron ABC transporter permease n=1 Tax=Streptomyces nanshensis TaxID=518642 RepID=A0A1E7L077_9ACTN|nr:iron ABC transporter permease [Streptomyces nanshensis]OEV09483.1 iron ABC transporter permease [Streptomyces nanshensis]
MSTVRGSAGFRLPLIAGLLTAGLALAALLSLALGSNAIPFRDVLAAVLTHADSDDATVITSQRLPRTLLGLAVGLALGMAGALMQGHTRNPLADPGLFGVNAGAAFAVACLTYGLGVSASPAVVLAALVGAAAVATVVTLFGLRGTSRGALVLLAVAGTALSALLTALTTGLVLLDKRTLDVMRFWQVGSLAGRDYGIVLWILPLLAAGVLLALVNAWSLDALGLGEETARALGTRVRRSRITGIVTITLLAGPATAVCGPIAFLGLVAPHAARALARHDQRWLVPLSGLTGAIVLLVADTLGRVGARPGELQAGIVMAVIGAPVLLALTRRRKLAAL